MAEIGWDYMGNSPQLFRRSMAEALATLLTQRYRSTKHLARGVGIDVKTAENLRQGHLSVTTLQKVMAAEGRSLWDKLGDELFGETFYQYEERRIETAIREAEHVRSNLVRLREAREELLAGAGLLDPAAVGPAADAVGRAPSRARAAHHGTGLGRVEGQGDHAPTAALEPVSFSPSSKRGRR